MHHRFDFKRWIDDKRYLHGFIFVREPFGKERADVLAQATETEMITLNQRTVYCLLKISILDSALGKGFIDRKLKVSATARNWRTVETLLTL